MITTVEAGPITKPTPATGPIEFGNLGWIAIRGEEKIDARRIHRAAEVAVERTPMFRVVGEPQPLDLTEIVELDDLDDDIVFEYGMRHRVRRWTLRDQLAAEGVIVDHDPAKYAPYSDLVSDGADHGYGYPAYFVIQIV